MNRFLFAFSVATFPFCAIAEPSLERGEYLVRGPAACGNCHTPQGPNGPDMSNELGGMMVEKKRHDGSLGREHHTRRSCRGLE